MTGLLALVTLVLTFHEPGAPRHVWLHLLAVAALLKYLPDGWFKGGRQAVGGKRGGNADRIALPFMVQQIRTAIYPQLAKGGQWIHYHPAATGADVVLESQMADAPEPASVANGSQSRRKIQLSSKNRHPAGPDWHRTPTP
jgi:hypothetical protein